MRTTYLSLSLSLSLCVSVSVSLSVCVYLFLSLFVWWLCLSLLLSVRLCAWSCVFVCDGEQVPINLPLPYTIRGSGDLADVYVKKGHHSLSNQLLRHIRGMYTDPLVVEKTTRLDGVPSLSLLFSSHITYHISHITSHHITPFTSHHITSHHITSHHITSHHITSHHITSHHITWFRSQQI